MTGSYIATTTEDDVQWLMAAGQSLGLSVAQLRHHLAQALSPAHGALLAEPVEDAAGRATDWYGAGEGAATPLDQLPPAPRAVMTNKVWALLRDIRAEGVRLGASADADERVLGAMLEKVSHVPDESCVRVRGDAPLLIAWGHGRAGQSVDLAELYQSVDVPRAQPASLVPDRPRGQWAAWFIPVLILAVVAVALVMWSRRQPSDTAADGVAPTSSVAEAPTPAPSSPVAAPPPQTRPDLAQTTPAPIAPTPAPTQASAGLVPTPSASTSSDAATAASPTSTSLSTSSVTQPATPPPTPSPSPTEAADRQPTAAPSATPSAAADDQPAAPPTPTASPNPPVTTADQPTPSPRPTAADRQAAAPPPTTPEPSPATPANEAPQPSPSPTQDAAQLAPHESEAAPLPRPFTTASVHKHDLAVLQGCWNLTGSFATADVRTRAAANVSQWRACFGPARPGAATLAGTQSLRWEDGKSCSGPVTARFLPDDKLEITDAADCLGDRKLFPVTEQCARKDDASMLCAWTARDRGFHGNGLALSPAR